MASSVSTGNSFLRFLCLLEWVTSATAKFCSYGFSFDRSLAALLAALVAPFSVCIKFWKIIRHGFDGPQSMNSVFGKWNEICQVARTHDCFQISLQLILRLQHIFYLLTYQIILIAFDFILSHGYSIATIKCWKYYGDKRSRYCWRE